MPNGHKSRAPVKADCPPPVFSHSVSLSFPAYIYFYYIFFFFLLFSFPQTAKIRCWRYDNRLRPRRRLYTYTRMPTTSQTVGIERKPEIKVYLYKNRRSLRSGRRDGIIGLHRRSRPRPILHGTCKKNTESDIFSRIAGPRASNKTHVRSNTGRRRTR